MSERFRESWDSDNPRRMSYLLLIGIYALPILFVWFLFGKGYARSTRRAALIYTFALPGFYLLTALINFAVQP